MKKVKIQKKLFWHIQADLRGSETTFFCANSKSKIVASVEGAYASKDKMVRILPKLKKKNFFYFGPQVPYLKRLYAIKIIKIEEMKNLTLGHL
jgi:hypothetical protein